MQLSILEEFGTEEEISLYKHETKNVTQTLSGSWQTPLKKEQLQDAIPSDRRCRLWLPTLRYRYKHLSYFFYFLSLWKLSTQKIMGLNPSRDTEMSHEEKICKRMLSSRKIAKQWIEWLHIEKPLLELVFPNSVYRFNNIKRRNARL